MKSTDVNWKPAREEVLEPHRKFTKWWIMEWVTGIYALQTLPEILIETAV